MKITQTLSSYGFQQVLFTFDPVGQKLEVIDSHLHADRKTNFGLAVNSSLEKIVCTPISRDWLEHPVTVVGSMQFTVTSSAILRRFR